MEGEGRRKVYIVYGGKRKRGGKKGHGETIYLKEEKGGESTGKGRPPSWFHAPEEISFLSRKGEA